MKHTKSGNNVLVELTEDEIKIIESALTNRMNYLGEMKTKEEFKKWAERAWYACLDLQCEFFNL